MNRLKRVLRFESNENDAIQLYNFKARMIECQRFFPSKTEITTPKVIAGVQCNPVKKEYNLHVEYLTDSAVLGIVRTTNSIAKFDSHLLE